MLHIQETNVNPELGYRVKVQAEDRTQQQSTGVRHQLGSTPCAAKYTIQRKEKLNKNLQYLIKESNFRNLGVHHMHPCMYPPTYMCNPTCKNKDVLLKVFRPDPRASPSPSTRLRGCIITLALRCGANAELCFPKASIHLLCYTLPSSQSHL